MQSSHNSVDYTTAPRFAIPTKIASSTLWKVNLRAHEDNSLATPKFFAMPRKNYLVEENKRRQVIPAHRNSRSTTLSGSFESEYHRLNHELQALCVVKSIADTRAQ